MLLFYRKKKEKEIGINPGGTEKVKHGLCGGQLVNEAEKLGKDR